MQEVNKKRRSIATHVAKQFFSECRTVKSGAHARVPATHPDRIVRLLQNVRGIYLLILLWAPAVAFANPVSFKDGWGIMPTYAPDWHDVQVNYSLTNHFAVGMSEFYRQGSEHTATFGIVQGNYLIKRWNEMESQANVYASLGGGGRHDNEDGADVAGYGALEADYETRRIYTLLSGETLQSGNGVSFSRTRARAGIAPYKAPIEALQTWIIVQVDYMTDMEDRVRVTPLLRFFYANYALEIGESLDGKLFLAAMAHF